MTLKSTRDMIEKVNISQAMNQCQIVTDTNYVYVELADGSQGKIKKSDLANVMNTLIGGLFPKLFSFPYAIVSTWLNKYSRPIYDSVPAAILTKVLCHSL